MKSDEIEDRMRKLQATPPAMPPPMARTMRQLLAALPSTPSAERELKPTEQLKRSVARAEREQALAKRMTPALLARLRGRESPTAILLGPTGIGKTAAAHWIAMRSPPQRSFWVYARELGSSERRHALGAGQPSLLAASKAAGFLVLDDLGTEEERDVGVVQELFEARYGAIPPRPTVITSGLTRDQLTARYGSPTTRRMREQWAPRGDGEIWPLLLIDLHPEGAPP